MNPQNPQEEQLEPVQNTQEETQENPVSDAKKILEIEQGLKDGITAIQEVLGFMMEKKVDLDKMKESVKSKLKGIINDNKEL